MKLLRLMWIAHGVVVVALGISFYWNIRQAEDAKVRGQELYVIGLRDGEMFARAQILRAMIEREIIEEQEAAAAAERNKL